MPNPPPEKLISLIGELHKELNDKINRVQEIYPNYKILRLLESVQKNPYLPQHSYNRLHRQYQKIQKLVTSMGKWDEGDDDKLAELNRLELKVIKIYRNDRSTLSRDKIWKDLDIEKVYGLWEDKKSRV